MMIHESLLFRFISFKIVAFSHLHCCPVDLAGTWLFAHRERFYREMKEIEKKAETTIIVVI